MGIVVYMNVCIRKKRWSQPIPPKYNILRSHEACKRYRTVIKPIERYDSCPEFKDKTIHYFEESNVSSIAMKEFVMNDWTGKLADMVGYHYKNPDAEEPGMFRDLFWGAGYENTFGPEAIYRLAIAFQLYQKKAKSMYDEDFMGIYDHLHEKISWAADDGNGAFWFFPG